MELLGIQATAQILTGPEFLKPTQAALQLLPIEVDKQTSG